LATNQLFETAESCASLSKEETNMSEEPSHQGRED